jgi:NAD-dependent deacetylase
LHKKANHNDNNLIEIHGNIHYKRKIEAEFIEEPVIADWNTINENNVEQEVLSLFNIQPNGDIKDDSYRPHILLFDEYYTELYKYSNALTWILEADTILFMGTSNSVGFTAGALQTSLNKYKKVIVVDPNPAPSFIHPKIELHQMSSTEFCKNYFSL